MRKLTFAVTGQKLSKEGDFSGITAGSKGYLCCKVKTTDPDWMRAKKVLLFDEEYAVAVGTDGECTVPDEVTDGKSFKLRLIGQCGKTRMMTNPILIEQVK